MDIYTQLERLFSVMEMEGFEPSSTDIATYASTNVVAVLTFNPSFSSATNI